MAAWKRVVSTLMMSAIAGCMTLSAVAQDHASEPRRPESGQFARSLPLPPTAVTRQSIEIGGTTYNFTAKVGALSMKDAQGNVQAEIGYIAYILDGPAAAQDGKAQNHEVSPLSKRPITVAINGGPGAASAYLNLLAIGPWRLPAESFRASDDKGGGQRQGGIQPSMDTALADNQESWLPFTDLVFIDPPGTGYSRVLGGEEARKRFYSLSGDVDILSAAIARFLRENDRLASPKFLVGESYGGFRAPLIAEKMQTGQGIGLKGLVMISPVLDFGWIFQSDHAVWEQAGLLPSLTAANYALQGKPYDDTIRKDVENYAIGPYISDLLRGPRDPEAVARLSDKVAAYTGLDPALVRRMAGRIDFRAFQRERLRDKGQVLSAYDGVVAGYDPDPNGWRSRFEDPVLSALTAPLTSAMVDLMRNRLGYKADDFQYRLLNQEVNGAWDWGKGRMHAPENMSELANAMALDPALRVLVIHGTRDLVTPYFTSQLLINQLPVLGDASRIRLAVVPGGHMFYTGLCSRQEMRRWAASQVYMGQENTTGFAFRFSGPCNVF